MRWIKAGFAGALMVGSVAAAAQTSDTIQSFSRADFEQALSANDASYEESANGRSINITFSNGLRANGLLMACSNDETEKGCNGTSILATFAARQDADNAETQAAINKYNYLENFGRAYLDPDGRICVRMYIISDGGITRENYERQIGLWEASLEDFHGYLYGTGEE